MATIKDIAKMAGVAQGTVSNVLNGKGNVSSQKIKIVLEAAATLGYTPNERAKLLRSGTTNVLAVILPNIAYKQYLDFYLSFKNYAQSQNYTVQLYITNGNFETEISILNEIKATKPAGIVTITSCRKNKNIYKEIQPCTFTNIIFIERHPGFPCNFIGFDYKKAGTALGNHIAKHGYKNVGLITGNISFSNEADFYNTFMQVSQRENCSVTHIQTDNLRKSQNIMELFNTTLPEAVFISNYGFSRNVKDIYDTFYKTESLKLYTVSPIFTLPENSFHKYELNYRLLGNTSCEALLGHLNKREELHILLDDDGFRDWHANIHTSKNMAPLNILTLDSPSAHTMKNLSRIYTKETGKNVNIIVYSYDEIYEVLNSMGQLPTFDVIRLDVTWLSWFAKKIFRPLKEIDEDIEKIFPSFLDGLTDRYSFANQTLYALPYSPSLQLLYYRKDLFEDTILKRIYHERYKTELKVPSTFEEFNQLAKFFTKAYNNSSSVDYGATITLGSSGVTGSEFLARYFSYKKNLYNNKNEIILNDEYALKALNSLIELKNYTPAKPSIWWRDTAKNFAQGNTAMSILYSNYASDLLHHSSKIIGNIGYAPIPGSNPLIGGGSIGVAKYSQQPKEALNFIKWICSEPISSASTFLGDVSPCKGTYRNYEIIDTFPWLTLEKDGFIHTNGHRLPPNNQAPFDERKFLGILGMAVKNAYNGIMKPQEALDYAQSLFEAQFPNL